MKELPEGFKPRHMHVIDCIHTLSKNGREVRVSDVNERLKITMPSVTEEEAALVVQVIDKLQKAMPKGSHLGWSLKIFIR